MFYTYSVRDSVVTNIVTYQGSLTWPLPAAAGSWEHHGNVALSAPRTMGNFCSSRADPEDSRQQYEKYTFLRQQILSKLSDEADKIRKAVHLHEGN